MTPVFSDVFTEMAVLLLMARRQRRAPCALAGGSDCLVAFIAVGILVCPSVLGIVAQQRYSAAFRH